MAPKAKIHRGKKGGSYRNHTVKSGPNKGKRVKVYIKHKKGRGKGKGK